MTTSTVTTNQRQDHRECPAALPSRGLGTREAAINLKSAGLTVGQQLIQDIRFRVVTLPEGWRGLPAIDLSAHGIDPNWWGNVIDQHGRTRATVQWISVGTTNRQATWRPLTIVYDVRAYTRAAIHGNAPLVLDRQWATRDAVLAAAQAELESACAAARDHTEHADNPHMGVYLWSIVDDVHRVHLFIETVQAAPEVDQ